VAHIPRDRRPDPHHDPSRRRADETVHRVQRLIRLSLQVILKPYHLSHDQHPYCDVIRILERGFAQVLDQAAETLRSWCEERQCIWTTVWDYTVGDVFHICADFLPGDSVYQGCGGYSIRCVYSYLCYCVWSYDCW
jgi:hypothetical protein